MINICFINFFGNGKKKHIIKPDNDQRKPLSNIGGNDSIAGLAITKPKPNTQGTKIAKKISLLDKSNIKQKVYYKELRF